MAKNARQRREAKRKLALNILANVRNPPPSAVRYGADGVTQVLTEPHKGHVRSSTTIDPRSKLTHAHVPFHGSQGPSRPAQTRFGDEHWGERPYPKGWASKPKMSKPKK
jgi:hypothetical protein